jgi:hypothetical protein
LPADSRSAGPRGPSGVFGPGTGTEAKPAPRRLDRHQRIRCPVPARLSPGVVGRPAAGDGTPLMDGKDGIFEILTTSQLFPRLEPNAGSTWDNGDGAFSPSKSANSAAESRGLVGAYPFQAGSRPPWITGRLRLLMRPGANGTLRMPWPGTSSSRELDG